VHAAAAAHEGMGRRCLTLPVTASVLKGREGEEGEEEEEGGARHCRPA